MDADGIGDPCDLCRLDAENDADGDGLCGNLDHCRLDADNDVDGDDVCGNVDNCPTVPNTNQEDSDGNGIGDACQASPTCSDGIDNDGDGLIDFPADLGCADAADTTETDPSIECDDGTDNDNDGRVDSNTKGLRDPGCGRYLSLAVSENPECNDGIDNDGDGLIDFDGNFGLAEKDPECGGFGFGTSEAVPEPELAVGITLGCLFLIEVRRRRSLPKDRSQWSDGARVEPPPRITSES
ncbi:MAG TPA: hypothetical protein ENI85_12145 [Deltaproteobacteria bacterium]|nr:hypothetical protein [Deltaproteobacteria bacterium]